VRLLVLFILLAAPLARAEPPPPVIELVTMGQSDDMFARYGHGTLCVLDQQAPRGRCYNYGTTNFSRPVKLTWDWLRGQTKFWVSRSSMDRTLALYAEEGRSVYRQRLNLNPAAARGLARALEEDYTDPAKKYYNYHHFHDNCTTRLRDHIDRATGGLLRRGTDVPVGPSYRELARAGFLGSAPLMIAAEIVIGRPSEQVPTVWQAMFLPDVLREVVARNLGSPAERVIEQTLPASTFQGSEAAGRRLMVAIGAGLAMLLALAALPRRRWPWRIALALVGTIVGLVGTVFWVVCAVTTHPEMRRNEIVLVFWATDWLLVFLGGKWLLRYAMVRLIGLALVALAALTGVLVQPLWAPLVIVAFPLAVVAVRERFWQPVAVPLVVPEPAPVDAIPA
jgi:Domain of unknown function (DUF4105)